MEEKQPLKSKIVPEEQAAPTLKPAAMSTHDKAMALELGKMDPSLLDQGEKIDCAHIYRSKNYPPPQIAAILGVAPRTASRYIAKARKNNAITVSPNFQAEFIGGHLNDSQAQCARIMRLSYSDKLSEAGKIHAICSAHKIEKDTIDTMERLGYLTKQNTEFNIKSELAKSYGTEEEDFWGLDLASLNSEQVSIVAMAKARKDKEMDEFMKQTVAEVLNKKESKPFEFSVEDIDFNLLKTSLRKHRNYDRYILENLGIKEYANDEEKLFSALTPEQLVAAMNGVLHVPSFAKQTSAKSFNSDFSEEAKLVIAKYTDNSSLKKYELMNLNARVLAERYPTEILDVYREKLITWEKQFSK